MESLDTHHMTSGPVSSRRVGRNLRINTVPAQVCTYSCLDCQAGRTPRQNVGRREFCHPKDLLQEVSIKTEAAQEAGVPIDALTFVPDGEPTLDIQLGREIELLRPLGSKIAVKTNASLLWLPEV